MGELATLVNVAVKCKGITPLLMNRVSPEELLKIHQKIKPSKNAGRPTPREECEKKIYADANNKPYLPVDMLWSCLVAAGKHVRLDAKRQISTASSTVLPSFMRITDTVINLDTPNPWEVDIRQGRNPNGGELVVLCRPRFDVWSFTANIEIDALEIGENKIRELFDIAGKRCGIGDFRPNRKGVFGQFVVEHWKV